VHRQLFVLNRYLITSKHNHTNSSTTHCLFVKRLGAPRP